MTERNRQQSWVHRATEKIKKAKPYDLFEHLIATILVLLVSFIVVIHCCPIVNT